jgi:hypothetical protein
MDGLCAPPVVHDGSNPFADWGPFDAMRFPLSYEGPLPSSGNPRNGNPTPKLEQIWKIRTAIHHQIRAVYDNHMAFQENSDQSRILFAELNVPVMVDGKKFFSIARVKFKLKCELRIELHVNHAVASVITNGADLDNRLKTLFDALRAPHNQQEIKGYMPDDIENFCCLLEDDVIISALQIETFRNTAVPAGSPLDHVRLNMIVRLEPMASDFINQPFRID